jgi:membrane protein
VTRETNSSAASPKLAGKTPLASSVAGGASVRQRRINRAGLLTAWETLADYARRIWINSGEDDIFFLAGGIAFNILLVALPFVLLVIFVLSYVLNESPAASAATVRLLIDRLLPPHPESPDAPVHRLLNELFEIKTSLGIFSAVGFVWFSTKLFGSLRSVLAAVFDIEHGRGIISGKLFDLRITLVATALLVAYFTVNAYLAIGTSRGVEVLVNAGIRRDVMGWVEYSLGRLLAFALVVGAFYAIYKYLPNRHIRVRQALLGALTTSILFEAARNLFTFYTRRFDPGSIYVGTLYAVVSIVFWVYYAAIVFIIGGEVAHVNELRRQFRVQRETFEE